MARLNALFLEVFLVILLGAEEFRSRNDLRHDLALEDSRFVQRRHRFARLRFLLGVMKENRGAVLRPVIRPLPVELSRVVALEEDGKQLAIGNLVWVEFD